MAGGLASIGIKKIVPAQIDFTKIASGSAAGPTSFIALSVDGTPVLVGPQENLQYFPRFIQVDGGIGTTGLSVGGTGVRQLRIYGDNTGDARLRIDNGQGNHYIFDDQSDSNNLKIESASGKAICFNTDGANERMKIWSTGRVAINDPSPVAMLNVKSDSLTALALTQKTVGTTGPSVRFRLDKRDGSDNLISVVSGDTLGKLIFTGHYNSAGATLTAAQIRAIVDGEPATGGDTSDMPGRLEFLTTLNGSNTETVRMTIKNDGRVGIGTTSPDVQLSLGSYSGVSLSTAGAVGIGCSDPATYTSLHIASPDGYSKQILETSTNNILGAQIALQKSRGTRANRSIVQENDILGYLMFQGWDGDQYYRSAAAVYGVIDGEPGSSGDTTDLPGRLEFRCSPDGEASAGVKMVIKSTGKVGIGQTNPPKTLTIEDSDNNTAPTTGKGLGGAAAGTGVLINNTDTTADSYANLDFRANNADGRIAYQYKSANSGDFHFIVDDNDGGAGFVTGMSITHDGRVGILDTAPAKTLTITTSDSNTAPTTGKGLAAAAAGTGVLISNTDTTVDSYANLDFRANDADGRIAYQYKSLGTGDFLFITDNANGRNVRMTISAAGTVSATTFNGTNLGGTLSTAAQTNITSLGTLTGLTVGTTGTKQIRIHGDNSGDARLRIDNGQGNHYIFDDQSDGNKFKIQSAHELVLKTNGTFDGFKMDDNGVIETPGQPCFAVYRNSNQDIVADGSYHTVTWNAEQYDIGGNFNISAGANQGIFTAPTAGKYLFTGVIEINLADHVNVNFVLATLVLSGTDHRFGVTAPTTHDLAGDITLPFAFTVHMDANNTAKIQLKTDGADIELDCGSPQFGSSFQGYFLG